MAAATSPWRAALTFAATTGMIGLSYAFTAPGVPILLAAVGALAARFVHVEAGP